jgi:mRNA interferase RelE/StbE
MAYQIVIEKKASKFLESVPKKDYLKLREHIYQLAEDPHPSGSIKVQGSGFVMENTASYIPYKTIS